MSSRMCFTQASLISCEMGALSKTTQVQFRDCAKIQAVKKNKIKLNYFISNRIAKTTEFHRNNSCNTLHVCIRRIYASRCYI